MSRQFSIPTILRMLPNKLLERLFAERGYIQLRWNWKGLKERDVEKLQNAIKMQPAASKALIESDLRELFELACDSGMTSIIEAALQCGLPDFADRMPEEGFYHRSIWTRLEYPAIFERALRLQNFEAISWWRKRNDLPKKQIVIDEILLARLSAEISELLHRVQGRGTPCTVEACEGTNNTQYFYAHPNDYARQATTHDEDQRLTSVTLRTTFSVVFAYRHDEGSLELHAPVPAKVKLALERLFAQIVFGVTLGAWEPDAVYDLDVLKDAAFQLATDPTDRIKVQVRALRLRGPRTGRRNTIEISEEDDNIHAAIGEWINKQNISMSEATATKATLRFEFQELYGRRTGVETIEITTPSTCNLNGRRVERVELIRKYLQRWNIDVTPTVALDFGPIEPSPGSHYGERMSQAS